MNKTKLLAIIFGAICVTPVFAESDETSYWNQFRGAHGDGTSQAAHLPVEFTETNNVRWKTAIHGKGWSSPVVLGKQIWLTTAREETGTRTG